MFPRQARIDRNRHLRADRGGIGAYASERRRTRAWLPISTRCAGRRSIHITVRPEIRDFYEHAAQYQLEVWTEVSLTGRFFLWLLVEFISRRMDQLNFPISSLEVAKGMSSEVLQLFDPNSGAVEATGWLRRLKSSGNVIYAGIYSVVQVPGEDNPCVKVTFPCRGSANVYLRPVAHADGSFGLDSSGGGFGRSGFYRVVDAGPDHWRVRNFTTLA